MDLRDKAGGEEYHAGRGPERPRQNHPARRYFNRPLRPAGAEIYPGKGRSYDRFLAEHIHKNATDNTTYIGISLTLDDGTDLCIKRSWGWNGNKLDRQLTVGKKRDAG